MDIDRNAASSDDSNLSKLFKWRFEYSIHKYVCMYLKGRVTTLPDPLATRISDHTTSPHSFWDAGNKMFMFHSNSTHSNTWNPWTVKDLLVSHLKCGGSVIFWGLESSTIASLFLSISTSSIKWLFCAHKLCAIWDYTLTHT